MDTAIEPLRGMPTPFDRVAPGCCGMPVARVFSKPEMRLSWMDVFKLVKFAESNPQGSPESHGETALAMEGIWRVVVLNDPVNLMSYVVMVFKKVFGFDDATARRHMLEVHEQGRSIVWSGLREKAEAYAFTLQQWHLTAVLESDEAH